MIDRGDAASAGPLLDTLTAAEEAVSTLARRLGLLGQVFDEQQQLIDGATGLDADTQTQLSNVVNDERGWPTELLVNAWPNPSSVDADLALKSKRVDSYSQFLHHYAHASAEARAAAPLQPAFDAFTNLDYDAGAAAMTAPAAGSLPQALPLAQPMAFAMLTRAVIHDQNVPAPAPHEAPPQTRRAPTPRHRAQPSFAARLTSIRTLLADNAGLFTAILFGLLVALVGLTELYSNKPSAGQSIADWVGFFAWGFAIELTGITTAQAALRLVPASGSASGTPKSPTP